PCPPPARGRARAPRRHTVMGGRGRRRSDGCLAMGRAAVRVRAVVHDHRDAGVRSAAGGVMTPTVANRASESNRLLRPRVASAAGWISLLSLAALGVLGLAVAPPDAVQSDAQRLMYVHVPAAWIAYMAFGITALASALWLWPRTRAAVWDRLAGASAE